MKRTLDTRAEAKTTVLEAPPKPTEARARPAPPGEGVIRFTADWKEVVERPLNAGEHLRIEYDLQRSPRLRGSYEGKRAWDVIGWVRFHPGADLYSGSVVAPMQSAEARPVPLVVPIPPSARQADVWFANVQQPNLWEWDSDFGRNYTFDVKSPPVPELQYRTDAVPSLEMVNVIHNEASAEPSGRPAPGLRLTAIAWVRNMDYEKHVWVDTHIYGEGDALLHGETFPLRHIGSELGGGDAFACDRTMQIPIHRLLQRPRRVQFRLYYQVQGRTYSDALLHEIVI